MAHKLVHYWIDDQCVYARHDVDLVIADLKSENERLNKELNEWIHSAANRPIVIGKLRNELRDTQRAMWLMTAEWADAMGLASCNIANKFMSRENFEVGNDYRNNTVKKYRHRQVVFYKYADYCRQKAEEYK